MGDIISVNDIEVATKLIHNHIAPTPLNYSPTVSRLANREVYFKWETKLESGAFKERGVINFLESLSAKQKKKGVCAASMGNHARGLSLYATRFGIPCTIVMPTTASIYKIQACKENGATVILEGDTFDDALKYARKLSKDNDLEFIHAFDHPLIMAGQGSCGLEVFEQLPDLDAVIVSVGGGGWISGVSTALKARKKNIYVMGVQSEWAVAHQRADVGIVRQHSAVTIADGIAVKKIGKFTAQVIESNVDKMVTVSELEITRAIVKFLEMEKALVEGAGAAPLAALLKQSLPKKCQKVVLLVSGGNIDVSLLTNIIQSDLAERGRRLRIDVTVDDRPGVLQRVAGMISQSGANILDVSHDRFFSVPGVVEIGFMLDVRDKKHGDSVIAALKEQGVAVRVDI